jgi:hypothetical protein
LTVTPHATNMLCFPIHTQGQYVVVYIIEEIKKINFNPHFKL